MTRNKLKQDKFSIDIENEIISRTLTQSNISEKSSDNSLYFGIASDKTTLNKYLKIIRREDFNYTKSGTPYELAEFNFNFYNEKVLVTAIINGDGQIQLKIGERGKRIFSLIELCYGRKIAASNLITFKLNLDFKKNIIQIFANSQNAFYNWAKNHLKINSVDSYITTLKNMTSNFETVSLYSDNIFEIFNPEKHIEICSTFKNDPYWKEANSKHNNIHSAALNNFIKFITDFFIVNGQTWSTNDVNDSIIKDSSKSVFGATNVIYLGAPGTGKSFKVNEIFSNGFITERTLFHPEYTYNDFIGYLTPTLEKDNVIYKFIQGPFTKILKDALKNPEKKYALIIDELNRGNASAIFGDIFQLLDRNSNGESQYSISNPIMQKIIEDDKQIKIPANLWIVATANTSDQNTFVMDTAFLRRWDIERLEIISGDGNNFAFNEFREILGAPNWHKFILNVNDFLVREVFDSVIEDRLIGQWFYISNENLNINNCNKFANKVLRYLWDDVLKHDRNVLFKNEIKTFSELLENFKSKKQIFTESFIKNINEVI